MSEEMRKIAEKNSTETSTTFSTTGSGPVEIRFEVNLANTGGEPDEMAIIYGFAFAWENV